MMFVLVPHLPNAMNDVKSYELLNRRFSIDLCYPSYRLVLVVERRWSSHGERKEAFVLLKKKVPLPNLMKASATRCGCVTLLDPAPPKALFARGNVGSQATRYV